MAEPSVLGPTDLATLNRALQSCADWSCVLDKLAGAGYDVEDLRAELQHNEAKATKLKAAFFPGHP